MDLSVSPVPFRPRDPLSALTHGIALLATLPAAPPLLIRALHQGASAVTVGALGLFLLSMALLYAASTAYHSYVGPEANIKRLKKLDHTMIFYLIAGSYTPVCLTFLRSHTGTVLLALVWALALAGTVFKLCWVTCPRWVSSVIYIAMGWSCLIAMPQILAALPAAGFLWLLLGGVLYTVGGVLYALKPKCLAGKAFGIHEIFHVFVMLGSVCHYVFMYLYVAV